LPIEKTFRQENVQFRRTYSAAYATVIPGKHAMSGLAGWIAAAVTPRKRHEEIDFGAAFELIDFLSRARIHGIALFTAAGEYPSLAADERSRLLYLAVKRSRAPLFAGIGAATLDGSLALARQACEAGAAAVLLPPPHFFRYEQDDIREFYLQFAVQAGSRLPVYIVDTPEWTTPIEPETLHDLLATGRFAGVADTISEAACAVPELVAALRSDDAALEARVQEFTAWTRQFPATIALKQALNLRGLKTGPFHVPLTPAKRLKLEQFGEWFQGWLGEVKKIAAHA
jgi:dihydrodipicolinate synthase/N-acetylneuraminate lyase